MQSGTDDTIPETDINIKILQIKITYRKAPYVTYMMAFEASNDGDPIAAGVEFFRPLNVYGAN